MEAAIWFAIGGALLVTMTLGGSWLERLPFSSAMLYLLVGVALGPGGIAFSQIDPLSHSHDLERLAEVVVLISLFTSGLKLGGGLQDRRWIAPLRLAVGSMLLTVAMIAAAAHWLLDLPLGAAILLGGILAPTDPVLASEVQLGEPSDRDQLRFALTAEGGLNDGTAFPVVMLGLGLLGLHEIGHAAWRWFAVDVLWATSGGIALGALLGTAVGHLVVYLRRVHRQAIGNESFLALGLIGLAYGASLLTHTYGFLAVFAAGAALRRLEQQSVATRDRGVALATGGNVVAVTMHGTPDIEGKRELATDPTLASAYMAHAVLSFNEQLDRFGEMAAVLAIGLLVWAVDWQAVSWVLVALTLFAIRPASVALGLIATPLPPLQRTLIGWFGIRGVGSMFYLMYAINHGVPRELASKLIAATLAVIVASIVLHGISVTPLMAIYGRRRRGRAA